MGRPRPFVHEVRVSVEQEQQLVARAVEHGDVSIPRLLVESALAGGADAARAWRGMAGELFRVSALLGKVGVNVNQIARATNATLETQPQTVAAMEAVVRVCDRIEALLVDLEAQVGGRVGGRGR